MSDFKIEIASVPDRKKLVAEIWFAEKLIAEINQEKGELEIKFYHHNKLIFQLDEFIDALINVKNKLHQG